MTNKAEFAMSEANFNMLDEVRATLHLISSMGMADRKQYLSNISKSDMITVLDGLQYKLKKIQEEMIVL